MNPSKQATTGPGMFQWNAGGWFGSTLGCVAWLAGVVWILVNHGQTGLALVPAGVFCGVLGMAVLLWQRRDRIQPFAALMTLLVPFAVAVPLVVVAVAVFGRPDALADLTWPQSPLAVAGTVVIVPAVIVLFLFQERAALKRRSSASDDS